jgi:hypothetical protein
MKQALQLEAIKVMPSYHVRGNPYPRAAVRESARHGISAQRVRWFKRGLDSGNPTDCDTFSTGSL